MALSEEEQRLLEQMEAALEAEDPRLADALRGSQRRWYRRRVAISAVAFVLGVTVLVVGMEVHPLVSIFGFVIMLASTVVGVTAWQEPGGAVDARSADRRHPGRSASDLLGGPEDRRRRRDDDAT
jgi:hypothetical protein